MSVKTCPLCGGTGCGVAGAGAGAGMSGQCPAVSTGKQCERERWHTGKHKNGTGAFRVTWGGRMAPGPKSASARAAKGLSGPRTPKAHACAVCCAGEIVSEVDGRLVSSLKDGRCADRDACRSRQPELDLGC